MGMFPIIHSENDMGLSVIRLILFPRCRFIGIAVTLGFEQAIIDHLSIPLSLVSEFHIYRFVGYLWTSDK